MNNLRKWTFLPFVIVLGVFAVFALLAFSVVVSLMAVFVALGCGKKKAIEFVNRMSFSFDNERRGKWELANAKN